MKLAVPREIREDECRVALVPESCKKLIKAGVEIAVESGAGARAFLPDDAFRDAGATVVDDAAALLGGADFVFKVQPVAMNEAAGRHEAEMIREGACLLTTLMPTVNLDAVRKLAERKITAFSTDCIPRTTRAQSMDTLSSMANIAGYKAVLIAANESPPPTIDLAELLATARATVAVPAAKAGTSNIPMGPFQRIVLASLASSAKRAAVSGPISKPNR